MPWSDIRWQFQKKRKTNLKQSYRNHIIIFLIIGCLALYFWKGSSSPLLGEETPDVPTISTGDGPGGDIPDNNGRIAIFAPFPGVSLDKKFTFDFFYMLLGQGVPGMGVPCPEEILPRNLAISLTSYVTGLNPVEPGSILASEITGFSLIAALPVTNGSDVSENFDYPEQVSGGNDDEFSDNGSAKFPPGEKPVILIYHTHITETFYPTTGEHFTDDLDVTVAKLGRMLSESLEEDYNIPVMHNNQVFDIPRSPAYQKARPYIREIIEENPQINIVVDLHRDGIKRSSTTATIEGEIVGKILMVVGAGFEGWEKNFEFALVLQQEIEKINPKISRGVRRQGFTYNQDLHERAVLVEVGGHLNSLEEVERTIPLLAEALANTYYDLFKK